MGKNATTAYIVDQAPQGVWRGRAPNQDIPNNRIPVPRLGWLIPRDEVVSDDAKLIWMFRDSALDNATFFLDTCFVRNSNLSTDFWKTLFQKRVVVTSAIWQELQLWIQSPINNRNQWLREKLKSEFASPSDNVIFLDKFDDPAIEKGCQYYKRVLTARKQVHKLAEGRLTKKLNRTPESSEIQSEIQRLVKKRGIQLANDGVKAEAKNSPHIYNDEDLVTRAVLHGIATGNEVTILTTDRGIQEQFYKLVYLIDTNYRSMLIAKKYVEQPRNFPASQEEPDLMSFFGLTDCTQIKTSNDFTRIVLPENYEFVMLACQRFGKIEPVDARFWSMAFCAEREMLEVIKIKGKTDGLNTDLLGGRNCIHHLSHAIPLDGICLLANENSIKRDRMSIADYNIAIFEGEKTSRFETILPDQSDTADVESFLRAESLIDFSPELRLSVTPIPRECHKLTDQELAYIFQLIEPSTLFVLDSTALAYRWPDGVKRALSAQQFLAVHPLHRNRCQKIGSFSESNVHWPVSATENERFSFATRYYRTLLTQRRMVGAQVATKVGNGRDEWNGAMLALANGHQAIRRARFGWKRRNAIGTFCDDIALVDGMLAAILEGTKLVFVTLRTSVFEQFYTLVNLLIQHYESFCLAEAVFNDGGRFDAPKASQKLQGLGLSSEIMKNTVQSKPGSHLPESPEQFTASCWLLSPSSDQGFYFRHGCFLAERSMWELLKTKSDTAGLNSPRHGEYNFRALNRIRDNNYVAISKDLVRPLEEMMPRVPTEIRGHLLDEISMFDLIHVQNQCDQIAFHW